MTLLATLRVPDLWEAIHYLCGMSLRQNLPEENNHIEGWNSKLKRVINKDHPNVYEIVETIKREQGMTEITI